MTRNDSPEAVDAAGSSNGPQTEPLESGISLNLVWLVSSSLIDHGFADLLNGHPDFDAGELVDVEPIANVWLSDEKAAIVQLTVKIIPRKQPTFEAQVSYAAQYVAAEDPVVPIGEFAWGNGLANLVPFVRAKLASLTTESRFPTFYLQPLNLAALQNSAANEELSLHKGDEQESGTT